MKKIKYSIMTLFIGIMLLMLPNISFATEVSVTRNIMANGASMKFNFEGLTLDTTHEYEYGITATAAGTVQTWHEITEYTTSTAVISMSYETTDIRDVINATDTGYITIKDKTADSNVLEAYAVDLKIPYLRVTNYSVISNGKEIDTFENNISIGIRNRSNSQPYYQYEKITDTNIINKYKEIKAENGDMLELESMLKTTIPTLNWTPWDWWNGFVTVGYRISSKNSICT